MLIISYQKVELHFLIQHEIPQGSSSPMDRRLVPLVLPGWRTYFALSSWCCLGWSPVHRVRVCVLPGVSCVTYRI